VLARWSRVLTASPPPRPRASPMADIVAQLLLEYMATHC